MKILAFPVLLALLSREALADCTAGNPLATEQSTPSSISPGFYIDLDNPASCTGELTAWTYCYYEPRSGGRIDVSFELQIWRVVNNTYLRVGRAITEDLQIPQRGRFQCNTIELLEQNYLDIDQGDLLGVRLFTPTLSMVADADSNHRLVVFNTTESGRSLHVSANIVGDPMTTASPTTATTPITAANSPNSDSTNSALDFTNRLGSTVEGQGLTETTTQIESVGTDGSIERESSPGVGPGGIAGTVLGLVVLSAVVGFAVMAIVIWRKRRPKTEDAQTDISMGIDNPGKALTMNGPHMQKVSQPLKLKTNGVHAQPTISMRAIEGTETGGRDGNWFNDSFENSVGTTARNAIHPQLLANTLSSGAAAATLQGPAPNGISTDENIYDIPEALNVDLGSSEPSEDVYDMPDEAPSVVNSCDPEHPKDATKHINETSDEAWCTRLNDGKSERTGGESEEDIYDDVVTNNVVANSHESHEEDMIYDDVTDTVAVSSHEVGTSHDIQTDVYELLEEVDTAGENIYEAVDDTTPDRGQIDIYRDTL